MLLKKAEASLCHQNPGFPEPVCVRGPLAALVAWWRGDMSFVEAQRMGLAIDGPKAFTRAFILLPFIIPTVLSTLAWKWMFDPTFSVINYLLFQLGIIHSRINWLGDPNLALISVIIVNIWRGVPFYAISLLAGLQTISPELHEAAAIDGARAWQRFRHVTWPLLLPVTLVIVLFSVIQTFADFQLVYVLTGGGPANATQLFATYAYQIGIGTGLLSQGATISLAVFPVLLLVVIVQLLYIRRVETH